MRVYIGGREQWEWCQRHWDPTVMAAAERLGDLLEQELDLATGESIPTVFRRALNPTLEKAGINRLAPEQRQKVYEILCQCWDVTYGAALYKVLRETGDLLRA